MQGKAWLATFKLSARLMWLIVSGADGPKWDKLIKDIQQARADRLARDREAGRS